MTRDRTVALVRNVRAQGGTVLEARRLLEALASDEKQRLREAREQRATMQLAYDLGFASEDGLLEAASATRPPGGVFPYEASTPSPRRLRAILEEQEDARITEAAGGNDVLAHMMEREATERRHCEDLAEMLGTSAADVEAMLEGAPRPAVDASAASDLRLAETIGVDAVELIEAAEAAGR
jgi:hypothetical protein